MNLSGNTILVAGGTSGIGLGLALRFRAAGNKVIIAGRRKGLLDQITANHEGLEGEVLDITDPASILALHHDVVTKHPDLNIVVAMAGIMEVETVLDPSSLDVAERTVATNLLGPIRLIHHFVPHLAKQEDAAVLTVSSGLGWVPLTVTPTYGATKAGVHSFTESLRHQLRDTSVQVIELTPPHVRTPLLDSENVETAMPLDDFLDETMTLLETKPNAPQILVERVKGLRYAEVNGAYDEVFAMLNAG